MFTSNEKVCCKRDPRSHHDSGLLELVGEQDEEDLIRRPRARAGHGEDSGKVPLQSRGCEEDAEQRKVRFRGRGQIVYGDEESSSSSGYGYGGRFGLAKTPPELSTPPDLATLSSEFAKQKTHGEHPSHGNQLLHLRAALNEKELQLVELREQHIIALNRAADARQHWEDALQSKDRVILHLQRTLKHHKSQHDRQEREIQENLYAFRKRQKQENVEVEKKELKVAFLEAKNAQFVQELVEQQKLITRMKRQIDEKEKSCANHFQKLEMMNGRIQGLKSALRLKEDEVATTSKFCGELKTLLWNRDSVIAELQLSEQQLQSSLAREEAAREAQAMSAGKIQAEEPSLNEKRLPEMENQHKSVAKEASHNDHLEREHRQSEMRKLNGSKDNFSNLQNGVVKDVNDKEGVMHRIQKRMHELQRSLRNKDMALSERNNEFEEALLEIHRLTEDYDALKSECEELSKRNDELESTVALLQYSERRIGASVSEALTPPVEVLPYALSLGGSTGEDLGFDDAMQDSMEWEQLSNASVYHANFAKIKIIEVEMPDIAQQQQQQGTPSQPPHPSFHSLSPERTRISPPPPPLPAAASTSRRPSLDGEESPRSAPPPNKEIGSRSSEFEENYNSIRDEIKKREHGWRKTEELMREALTRRMKLLGEARDVQRPKTEVKSPEEAELEMHDRSCQLRTHHHHLQAAARARGNPDRNSRSKQGDGTQHRNQTDKDRGLPQHTPRRRVSYEDGHKCHGNDGVRVHRQAYEQESYQHDCRLNHDIGDLKRADLHQRRRLEHELLTDRRRSAEWNGHHLEERAKPVEHSGHRCHHRRRGRT